MQSLKIRHAAFGCVFTALATLATAQSTQQQCFSRSIPVSSTPLNGSMTFPRFDPALGTLTQISYSLTGGAQGSAAAENLSPSAPSNLTMNFAAQLQLTRPDLSVIVVALPLATFNDTLSPFDGAIDFGGPSGVFHGGINASNTNSAISPPPISDLALFTGMPGNPGTITLPVIGTAASTAMGNGNEVFQFLTQVSADCTICYTYTVNTPPDFNCVGSAAASVGVPFSQQFCASDTDPGDVVTITATGLPPGSSVTPPLPASGNPICVTFNWTPGPTDTGNFVIVFTATDSHGATRSCTFNLLVAECHQLFGLQAGNSQINIFGHFYDTYLGSMTQFFPVTRESIPNFQIPHAHQGGGLEYYPAPFYVQVVMYNPQMFPTNPQQWTRGLRVQPNADGTLATSYFGQANGMGIRARTFTNAQGQPRMDFPFTIFGMP